MRYVVTGGAGFIGSHMVDELLAGKHTVFVIDDFSKGKEENLAHHASNPYLFVFRRSICDPLDDIFNQQIDVVFHFAALSEVQYSIEHPDETHHANIDGIFNLLHYCKKYGVKRFVFSSSSSVYGDQDSLPFVETMKPNPMSPYAMHKLVGEHYCKLFHFLYGVETISLRYFNVYGPRQNPNGNYACLVPRFIMMMHEGRQPTINGDGEQTRDYVYVKDVVRANLAAGTTKNEQCFGKVFNVGLGRNTTINNVSDIIVTLTGHKVQPRYGPAVIEPRHALPDISRAKNYLGWEPKVGFEEGLQLTHAYFTRKAR